jgi:septal ring factor EnvC (AmiA/AmiB activator)
MRIAALAIVFSCSPGWGRGAAWRARFLMAAALPLQRRVVPLVTPARGRAREQLRPVRHNPRGVRSMDYLYAFRNRYSASWGAVARRTVWVGARVSLAAALGVLLCAGPGCSNEMMARVSVAKDKALQQIDKMLGELDVKRKEVALSLQSLKAAVAGMGKARIKSQVKMEQLEQKAQASRDQIAQADASLAKLRTYLQANQPVEINGKTYTLEALNRMAVQIIDVRKGYASQIAGLEKSQEALRKVALTMERNQQDYQKKINALESQLTEIDSQMVAIRTMREASSAMGDGNATLAENVSQLEDKVADLLAGTRAELSTEGSKWNVEDTDRQIDSAEAFILATQSSGDSLAEIDRILGTSK